MKYYIKNNLVFSSLTEKIKIIDKVQEIEIPQTNKSHLINNKILITDIDKILKNQGRKFEISKPINNFENIKKEILENKSKLKKVTANDYEFIEKTSGIDILKSIILSVENSNINQIEEKINNYILKTSKQEIEKNTEIEEAIQIEKNKKKEIETKKEKILSLDSIKKLEKLEIQKNKLTNDIQIKEKQLAQDNNQDNQKISSILKKQEEINHQIQDLKFKIKINKNKIKTLKSSFKLGKTKQYNILTIILIILTLGLFYWTKYVDTKYYILKTQEKIAKSEEKISKLELEKFNLEKNIKDENKNQENKNEQKDKKREEIRKKIDKLNIELEKNKNKNLEIEKIVKKEDLQIKKYDKEILKVETKILDLESTQKEFNKYSTKKIKEKLNELSKLKLDKLENLKQIKEKIESQKINISKEYIIEL